MKAKELRALGIPPGKPIDAAKRAAASASRAGLKKGTLRSRLRQLAQEPETLLEDPHFGAAAELVVEVREAGRAYVEREEPAPWRQWGDDLDPKSIRQMKNACRLPVSRRAALMPDAHVGYGLPIGGVLATENAVIPYAVGVDIACRVKMTVLDLPVSALSGQQERLRKAIEHETRFGIGASFRDRREHDVLDEDWSITPVTKRLKDKAWAQLGTSGSGNHFVEFGTLEIPEREGTATSERAAMDPAAAGGRAESPKAPEAADGGRRSGDAGKDDPLGLEPGIYLALLSHSGSRGAGATVASHYSRLAMDSHPELPKELRHLAWLDLDSQEGQEYWEAMTLMGKYAEANHACIHRHLARHLGAKVRLDLENHHNFAWKETHDGVETIVHRKGATPAGPGVLGIIPGSMATPTYVVRGRGSVAALDSAAHGAGRVMSRTQAKHTIRWKAVRPVLEERGVTLLSAGLDEAPAVYKDIDAVMAAQSDLVEPLARFFPRIVKMAPEGERPED